MVRRLAVVTLALVLPALSAAPQESEEVLGAPAAFGDARGEERVPVPAGSILRELPDPRAPALATVDAPSELPLLERRGRWARVRYGAVRGWVLLAPDVEAGDGLERPAALPGRSADPELLARALSRLGGSGEPEPGRLGPFVFYTDLADPGLAGLLDRVVEETLRLYRERYGLDPGLGAAPGADPQEPRETVVLFQRESDYRAFAQGDAALAGLEEEGLAGFGLAALFAGSRSREEVAALLVHEAVHLLNARALGPRMPPWLDEGLAVDLSYARIDAAGRLDLEGLGGKVEERRTEVRMGPGGTAWEVTVTTGGGRAALGRLEESLDRGELPSLGALTSLSWRELVDPGRREIAYAESAFFIRYLLESEGLAAGFRAYLRSVAAGGAGEGPDLLRALDRPDGDWESLDRGFRRWLRAEALRGDR